MNLLKIHKFAFKNVIFTTTKYEMYLKILQKLRYPAWLHIFKNKLSPARKKTMLNSSKDNFTLQSFPLSTKRKVSIFLKLKF